MQCKWPIILILYINKILITTDDGHVKQFAVLQGVHTPPLRLYPELKQVVQTSAAVHTEQPKDKL